MWLYILILSVPVVYSQWLNPRRFPYTPNYYLAGMGSTMPSGLGYLNSLGYANSLFSPVSRSGLASDVTKYSTTFPIQYKENEKLSGVSVFGAPYTTSGSKRSSALAVTITKNQANFGGLFGDNVNSLDETQGLSMTIQAKSPESGVYHVVFTTLARVQDGCNLKSLGDILDSQQPYSTPYFTSDYGVIATIELYSNVMKSVSLARIPRVDQLEELAGRGLALCLDNDSGSRPCHGYIAACVGLHYSQHDALLDQTYKDGSDGNIPSLETKDFNHKNSSPMEILKKHQLKS
ncbi:uncharacterized protein LOC106079149 isoform X3 [Biomphalaria glabrata]|uniref:Uncharacterized protein LOC106079149 isoform X3 n=1 Tax=Biomphalaria glabrata TaxID=6526 RepID=A0A9W3A002_BIOGL|nr:uncharacterized protein LOC106079149 isoform X3 [Biomphalaria glabrata]